MDPWASVETETYSSLTRWKRIRVYRKCAYRYIVHNLTSPLCRSSGEATLYTGGSLESFNRFHREIMKSLEDVYAWYNAIACNCFVISVLKFLTRWNESVIRNLASWRNASPFEIAIYSLTVSAVCYDWALEILSALQCFYYFRKEASVEIARRHILKYRETALIDTINCTRRNLHCLRPMSVQFIQDAT